MASFGYSVGDFFTVVQFAYDTFQKCKSLTSDLKDLGREVGNAHLVIRTIYAFWKSEEDRNRPLVISQQEDLKQLAEKLHLTLKAVENVRQKHGSLQQGPTIVARLKYVVDDMLHDFASIRENIRKETGALTTFHTLLTADALANAAEDQREILQDLKQKSDIIGSFVQSYIQSLEGKRAEPAYSQAARSAAPEQQEEQTIRAAQEELEAEGITKAIILKHQDLIKEWLQTVVLAPTDDGKENVEVDDDSSTTAGGGDATERKQKSNRSNSFSTHRSQSSTWVAEEADNIDDYGPTMIAKVLRSKYPPASGNEMFALPIKRAFNHLDLSKRGWLPLAEVEEQCSLASSKLNWTFDQSTLARIVRIEDEKDGNPDHRIHLQEFTSIILATRGSILLGINAVSKKGGLRDAVISLQKWYSSPGGLKALSPYWGLVKRFETVPPRTDWDYIEITTYSHLFGGAIPKGTIPLTRNFTNAIYLATRYCVSRVTFIAQTWRPLAKRLKSDEQREIFEGLDNVLESASKYHSFEYDHGAFHWLDDLITAASTTPSELLVNIEGRPLPRLKIMQNWLWTILDQILGFVHDLGPEIVQITQKNGVAEPEFGVWRERRMLDRSRMILAATSPFETAPGILQNARKWQEENKSLSASSDDCVQCTLLLRQVQEKLVESASSRKIKIENVRVATLQRTMFRSPKISFDVAVDGEFQLTNSDIEKGTTPAWEYYNCEIVVNYSSSVRICFYNRSREYKKSLLGYVDFEVKDTADFHRPLEIPGFRIGTEPTVTFSVTPIERPELQHTLYAIGELNYTYHPTRSESQDDKIIRMDRDLSLAAYIISHPIPEGWELRRNKSGHGVYFFNLETSKPTSMIWFDPLYENFPEAKLEPLPKGWERVQRNRKIEYRSKSLEYLEDIKKIPNFRQPKTFQYVLQPLKYHFPEEFYIDKEYYAEQAKMQRELEVDQLMKQLQA